jgi:uncharacterized membrane protein
MNTILIIALVAAMGLTAYVLVRGVMAMASGKDVSGEVQQNYMRKRIMFQAIAILIVVIILAAAGAKG